MVCNWTTNSPNVEQAGTGEPSQFSLFSTLSGQRLANYRIATNFLAPPRAQIKEPATPTGFYTPTHLNSRSYCPHSTLLLHRHYKKTFFLQRSISLRRITPISYPSLTSHIISSPAKIFAPDISNSMFPQ